MIVLSELILANAASPIYLVFFPILTDLAALHPSNAPAPMLYTVSGSVTADICVQPLNAFVPITSSLAVDVNGKDVTTVFENAPSPIYSSDVGYLSVTSESFVLAKQELGIAVILLLNFTDLIPEFANAPLPIDTSVSGNSMSVMYCKSASASLSIYNSPEPTLISLR